MGSFNQSPGLSCCSQPKGHFITQHAAAFKWICPAATPPHLALISTSQTKLLRVAGLPAAAPAPSAGGL